MSVRKEKTETGYDLVFEGFDKGIGMSPHKGIANMQAVNINTESGEVMCSFGRIQQTQSNTNATGTLTFIDTSHLGSSMSLSKGVWITVSGSTHTGELPNGNYYVLLTVGGGFVLSATYNGSGLSGYTAGLTASFNLIRNIGLPVDYTVEKYNDTNGAVQFRYYVLDAQGLVWVYDTANDATVPNIWFLPDTVLLTGATGIEVLNGWVFVFGVSPSTSLGSIVCKPTVALGTTNPGWTNITFGTNLNPNVPHFAYSGHQGTIIYCDGSFLGTIFPNSSLKSGISNIQSFSSYTAVTTTGTITDLLSGSLPISVDASNAILRVPAVFSSWNGGTIPSALSAHTIYWIQMNAGASTFSVYAAQTGGSALDIQSGSSGTQYFNTFYPIDAFGANTGSSTWTFTPQALNLPDFETATSIIEIGNTVVVGGKTNTLYPWNQVDVTPGDLIELPEDDVHYMIAVNNMGYVFCGHKGNIYITNGSTASAVISIPDYCAGIAGTPASYVEPYFTWGGADYIRGRVYFSIQDQTATKAGNCGGVWSFIPTQNFFFGQDVGLSLRMENQNSYANYNGVANLIIANQVQTAVGVQYFSAWTSSVSSPTYGIDGSATTTLTAAVIETDVAPTGTMLTKKTFSQVEYKLSAPLTNGEVVSIKYRLNLTDAWTPCGTLKTESTQSLSGYYPANFQLSQLLQFQVTLNPGTSSSGSFIRLTEIRLRQ